jgi:DNA-binding NarL/FixJ family response regulator
MRDRAASLGGRVEVESAPGRGTRLTVRVPVEGADGRGTDRVRILIVDDHLIVREGLRWLLGQEEQIEIAGEAATAEAALAAIPTLLPDVVLLDLHPPDRSGLEVLREVHERFPHTPVVVLTMLDQPEYVEEAVRAGAAGYLVKNAPQAELTRAVRAAAGGDAYIQAEVTRPLLARFAQEVRAQEPAPLLAPREREVVGLLAEGLADKQIAARLGLSQATVKGYIRTAYEKLGASDRAQAVAIAIRGRLID